METKAFYFTPEVLLIVYGSEPDRKKPQFLLKSEFEFCGFTPDQEPEPAKLTEVEFTTDPELWQAFVEQCSQFQIEPDACISAFFLFLVNPSHRETAERLLCDDVNGQWDDESRG